MIKNQVVATPQTKKLPQKNKTKKNYTVDPEEKVKICLSCTKSAKECKGKCWGKY